MMALKRDFASRYVLGRLLEHYGCKVYYTCNRNFIRVVRYWKPHAFIHTTPSIMKNVAEACPDTNIFFYAGEGSEGKIGKDVIETSIFFDDFVLERTKRIYLWGDRTRQKILEELKNKTDDNNLIQCAKDKLFMPVVGYPRADISRYLSRKKDRTIGILGHLPLLNPLYTEPIVYRFFGEGITYLKEIEAQVRELICISTIIDYIIDHTKHNISLRPYPLENADAYSNSKDDNRQFSNPKYDGRITIDRTLDFSTWASRQDVIISTQSTAISDAFIMGIPFVTIDNLAGNNAVFYQIMTEYGFRRTHIHKLLSEAAFVPKTFDELFQYLEKPEKIPIHKEKLKEFWNTEYALNQSGSPLNYVAQDVIKVLNDDHHDQIPLLPEFMLDFMDFLLFKSEKKALPALVNFNYKKGYHPIDPEYDEIAERILNE